MTEAFLKPASSNVTFMVNGTAVPAPRDINASLHHVRTDPLSPFGSLAEQPTNEVMSTVEAISQDVQMNLQSYRQLSNYECIAYYGNPYHFRPNVLLISTDYESAFKYNTSLLGWSIQYTGVEDPNYMDPTAWSGDLDLGFQAIATLNESITDAWRNKGFHVQYCLQVPDTKAAAAFDTCQVQCAPSVLLGKSRVFFLSEAKKKPGKSKRRKGKKKADFLDIVTGIFNFWKCFGVICLFYARRQHTLSTLGDAIASFLEYSDDATKHVGIATLNSVKDNEGSRWKNLKRQSTNLEAKGHQVVLRREQKEMVSNYGDVSSAVPFIFQA